MERDTDLKLLSKQLIHTYYCDHNWKDILEYVDKESISWIGISDKSEVFGYDNVRLFFQKGADNQARIQIIEEEYKDLGRGENYAVVYATVTFEMETEVESFLFLRLRHTFIYHYRSRRWEVIHTHVSVPSDATGTGKYFPDIAGRENYAQLQRMLKEKTQQIEMIARTTAGGMKGSLDDEMYTYFYVNDELCSMLGYTYKEFMEMSGGTAVGAVYPPDLSKALKDCEECFKKGPEYKTEYRIRKKDGTLLWVMDSGRKVIDDRGETKINSIITDISELKEAVNQAEIERERYEIVSELTDDVIFEYDMATDRLMIFYPVTADGEKEKRVIEHAYFGEGAKDLGIHEKDYDSFYHKIQKVFTQKKHDEPTKAEYRIRNINGQYIWRRVLMKNVFDSEDKLVKVIGKVIDISAERELVKQSVTDTLTGAYNRSYIESAVESYLLTKSADVSLCCMLVDIDYFKEVNDKQGHLAGDCVLIDTVQMARQLLRATDIVARMGGDEFMILIKDIYSADIVREKAEKLLSCVNTYGKSKNFQDKLSLSIGIVMESSSDCGFKELYRKADIALYHAKAKGRDRYIIYEDGMDYPAGI